MLLKNSITHIQTSNVFLQDTQAVTIFEKFIIMIEWKKTWNKKKC